jgi:hypothetical protein
MSLNCDRPATGVNASKEAYSVQDAHPLRDIHAITAAKKLSLLLLNAGTSFGMRPTNFGKFGWDF